MQWTKKIINAIKTTATNRPKLGRVITPRAQDSFRDYPSAGLTPAKLAAILREADDGSLTTAMQLFEEMEEKDAHLYSVANTRRLALTGLDWQIVSAADVRKGVDQSLANEAANHAREILTRLESLDDTLQHLALALGRNVAVSEIIWGMINGQMQPIDLAPVDFSRIAFDELDHLRILTQDHPDDGIEPPPNKFIIHTPHSVSGHPQRGGLLRVTALAYLAKNLSLKDWLIFAEVFGMPIRVARYEPNASPEEKRELLTMLESLGSNAAGIFSRAVELQIVEANRGTSGPPYERLLEFLNREMSKAWLGQTLTTDVTGQRGSLAASQVQDEVRKDILADDLRKEGRTIRRGLLAPITRLRFGDKAPVPFFCRRPRRPTDARELAEILNVAVNQLGVSVPQDWARDVLGIPAGSEHEPALEGLKR